MNDPTWTMRNGHTMRIRDMTDDHLANTIAMLERQTALRDERALWHYSNFDGDMQSYVHECEHVAPLSHESSTDPKDLFPVYKDLCEERDERKRNGPS